MSAVEQPMKTCSDLFALKASTTPTAIAKNTALVEQYRIALANCSGLNPKQYQLDFAAQLSTDPVANVLTGPQKSAWQELHEASKGEIVVSWDASRRTPAAVYLARQFPGTTGASALAALDADVGDSLFALFGADGQDELVLRDEQEFSQPPADDLDAPITVFRRVFDRHRLGYPVFTEVFELTARTHDYDPEAWAASAHAHWTRDLPLALSPPVVSEQEAVVFAELQGEVPAGAPLSKPRLGIWPQSAELAYEMVLANGAAAWRYYVSAETGEVLSKGDQVAHYTGTLKTYVSRPGEGNTKTARPIPEVNVYEDTVTSYPNAVGCPQSGTDTIWQTKGTTLLGQTDYSGNYSLSPIEPGDTSWAIDLRGPKVVDKTIQAGLAFPSFTASGTTTFPLEMTSLRARRAEIFYLLSYGYKAFAASNVTQSTPVQFSFFNGDPGPYCQLDTTPGCCSGAAIYAGNGASCITIDCASGGDMGTVAAAPVERRYRYTIFHEHGHTLFENATAGGRCAGLPDNQECWAAEEGRADYTGMALSRFDSLRSDGGAFGVLYRPDKKYPGDFAVGEDYRWAQPWAAMYAHLLQRVGVVSSLQIINRQLAQIGKPTVMVGSCTDINGDGYITHYECPANSYFRHLLNGDWAIFPASQYHGYEISEVFHRHVTDADRFAAGTQTFPWADQLPNDFFLPPIIDTELIANRTISSGPDYGSGAIRFDQSAVNSDHDTVLFFARAGDSYTVETLNLAPGVDTILEILQRWGPTIIDNDDCGGSLRSCITWTAQATGYYPLRVHPYPGSATGPAATYSIKVSKTSDDFGDDKLTASPILPNDAYQVGSIESIGDVDEFRIASAVAQTIRFESCSDSGLATVAELRDANDVLLTSVSNTTCPGTKASWAAGVGYYYVRVRPSGFSSGSYKVRVEPLADIDSGPTQAWSLNGDTSGPVVCTPFETSGDNDWFSFYGYEGRGYQVETFGGLGGNNLEIYAPSSTIYGRQGTVDSMPDTSGRGLGHWMLQANGGAFPPLHSRLAFVAPAAGTYYIRVTPYLGANYCLSFENTGLTRGWASMPYP